MQNKREYQKVIDYLYKLIESGQLTVGERLPTERTLAETLSISRNSIREAIRSLENMGIIESRAGSGNYIVNKISGTVSEMLNMMMMLKQIDREEVCSFRRNLDKAVCFTIIESGLSEEYSKKLSAALAAEQNADTLEEQNNCDYDFHYTLIMATQNGLWISIAEAVISIYRRWINECLHNASENIRDSLTEAHRHIFEALKNGNKLDCETWINRHYDIVENEIIK